MDLFLYFFGFFAGFMVRAFIFNDGDHDEYHRGWNDHREFISETLLLLKKKK